MHKKLYHLKQIRKDIGEETFRIIAASITANHYTKLLELKGESVARTQLMNQTNFVMRSLGCEAMSYGFYRKFL